MRKVIYNKKGITLHDGKEHAILLIAPSGNLKIKATSKEFFDSFASPMMIYFGHAKATKNREVKLKLIEDCFKNKKSIYTLLIPLLSV